MILKILYILLLVYGIASAIFGSILAFAWLEDPPQGKIKLFWAPSHFSKAICEKHKFGKGTRCFLDVILTILLAPTMLSAFIIIGVLLIPVLMLAFVIWELARNTEEKEK